MNQVVEERGIFASTRPVSFNFKAFILSLSFSNLVFLNAWADLPTIDRTFYYKYSATWQELMAVTLDVLLLAILLWVPVVLIARSHNRKWIIAMKWCVLAGLVIPVNMLRIVSRDSDLASVPGLELPLVRFVLIALSTILGAFLLWKWERLSTPVTSTVLLLLAPALPVVVLATGWRILEGPAQAHLPDVPAVPVSVQHSESPHVLWFVFDEWDQGVTFERRPAGLQLPELDRLRSESLYAPKAYPPSRVTRLSLPSLISGKTFIDSRPSGPSDMLLRYAVDRPEVKLSSLPTVFSEAEAAGFNSAIVGYYLPYCRMFRVTACKWFAAAGVLPFAWEHPSSILQPMAFTAYNQISNLPLARRLGLATEYSDPALHEQTYQSEFASSMERLLDPQLHLLFVHWSVPHPPAFGGTPEQPATYTDSIKLVDATMREVRQRLEAAGRWDSTAILITADHPLRVKAWGGRNHTWARGIAAIPQANEVPFLLKLPGQKAGSVYAKALQTIVTKELLLAIMRGEISTPDQAAVWLDTHPPKP